MIDASTLGIHRVPYAYLTGHIQANSEHGEYLQINCTFLSGWVKTQYSANGESDDHTRGNSGYLLKEIVKIVDSMIFQIPYSGNCVNCQNL